MAQVCKNCGKALPEGAVTCPACGAAASETAKSGEQQTPVIVNVNTAPAGKIKSKWAAVVLCFFLGVFGAHKFYEGKVGMGILYLLTAGLFGIGAIVDFFILLFKPTHYYV